MKKILLFFSAVIFLLLACSKTFVEEDITPTPPDNPFDAIDYSDIHPPKMPLDSNTFAGLHAYIFNTRCNQPACHDGTFEPDFRTVQSAYNTLVQHPVKKNYDPLVDGRDPLPYRVTPGSLDQSMMWQRLTRHEPPNFERMPSSGNQLPDNLLNLIKNWIEDGARDAYGVSPNPTNLQPNCFGLLAYVPFPGVPGLKFRVDTIRVDENPFNTFVTLANEETELWLGFLDFLDANNYDLGEHLTNAKIELSDNLYDFSNAVEVDLEFVPDPIKSKEMFGLSVGSLPPLIQKVFMPILGQNNPYHYRAVFDPVALGFPVESFVFMRITVQDEDHEPTVIPENSSVLPMSFYYSFYIFQP
ncbi:MAG: hypothetical protein D6714_04905 [Bacteroidetes bacterium]|nr:MAG: hypothetical protein D6714_04905 [Bacteroidota bacterium]